jgi:CBS domain-containing protein
MNAATILKFKGSGVFTTTANKSLLDIARLLVQHSIGCIVIVGDDDKIAGIMSERDLIRAIGQAGPKVLNEPVSNFMTKTVITAREADTSEWLMSKMTTHRFRHMPVVEMGRLIGLVSIGDLVKMQIAGIEMEAAATREYTGCFAFKQASQLRLEPGGAWTRKLRSQDFVQRKSSQLVFCSGSFRGCTFLRWFGFCYLRRATTAHLKLRPGLRQQFPRSQSPMAFSCCCFGRMKKRGRSDKTTPNYRACSKRGARMPRGPIGQRPSVLAQPLSISE